MSNYVSIMVQAYSLATAKTIQESLIDLSVENLIDPSEIENQLDIDDDLLVFLQQDHKGINLWVHNKQGAEQ